MKIELCDEDIFHFKSLLEDNDVMKIAFDKQSVWPFTVIEIIKIAAQKNNESTAHLTTEQSTPCYCTKGERYSLVNEFVYCPQCGVCCNARRTFVKRCDAIAALKGFINMARKIIQISSCSVENTQNTQCDCFLFALCDDGTLWEQRNTSSTWQSISAIPSAPEVLEAAATDVQQLKSEIAALVNVLASCYQVDDGKRFSETIIKLRQLSAV